MTWVHKRTGGKYEIVCFAVREADLVPLVIYQSTDPLKPTPFVRTCEEFFDGRFITEDKA